MGASQPLPPLLCRRSQRPSHVATWCLKFSRIPCRWVTGGQQGRCEVEGGGWGGPGGGACTCAPAPKPPAAPLVPPKPPIPGPARQGTSARSVRLEASRPLSTHSVSLRHGRQGGGAGGASGAAAQAGEAGGRAAWPPPRHASQAGGAARAVPRVHCKAPSAPSSPPVVDLSEPGSGHHKRAGQRQQREALGLGEDVWGGRVGVRGGGEAEGWVAARRGCCARSG